jgi:hypothetical protein
VGVSKWFIEMEPMILRLMVPFGLELRAERLRAERQ